MDSVSTIDDKARKLIQEQKASLLNLIVNVGLAVLFGYEGLKPPTVKLESTPEEDQSAGVDNPVFLLQKMYDHFKACGVGTIVLLIDRLDQSGQDRNGEDLNNPENIVRFLAPLLTHTNLLELKDSTQNRQVFGFKFFLPYENAMRNELNRKSFKFDRILPQTIEWSEEQHALPAARRQ